LLIDLLNNILAQNRVTEGIATIFIRNYSVETYLLISRHQKIKMSKIKLQILFLIAVFSVSSCVATIPLMSPSELTISENSGIIILSITVSGECGYATFLDVKKLETSQIISVSSQEFLTEPDWEPKEKHCPTPREAYSGRLHVAELASGTYEIFNLEWLSIQRRIYSKDDMNVRFYVRPGKVTYIGNLHVHLTENRYDFDLLNNQDRDVSLFYEKHSEYSQFNIVEDMLQEPAFPTVIE